MCGCNLKAIAAGGTYTVNQVMQNTALVKEISENKIISGSCFREGHADAWFRYMYCAQKKEFVALFKPYGIEVNNAADVMMLAAIHDNGNDKAKFNVNFMDLVKSITLTSGGMADASCAIFCDV